MSSQGAKTGALFPLEEGAGSRGISLPHTEPWPDRPRHCGAISHRVRIWVRRGSDRGAIRPLYHAGSLWGTGRHLLRRASQQPPISIITRNRVVHHLSSSLSCLATYLGLEGLRIEVLSSRHVFHLVFNNLTFTFLLVPTGALIDMMRHCRLHAASIFEIFGYNSRSKSIMHDQ